MGKKLFEHLKNMCRIKLILVICLVFSGKNLFAQGYPVFDNLNWLGAIDRFYQGYDNIMNTIKIIEQNYERIEHAYKQAKSWSFEDIDFNDGEGWKAPLQNLDIRDDIRDATKSINKQLNNIREIRDTFEKENLNINGISFSMKDLLDIKGEKHLGKIMQEVVKMEVNDAKEAWNVLFDKSFTNEEREKIWKDYGLTPANFIMVQNASQKVEKASRDFFDKIDDEVKKAQRELLFQKTSGLVDMLYEASDGEITEKQIGQVEALLNKLQTDELHYLREALETAASYTCYKDVIERQKKEQEDSTAKALKAVMEEKDDDPEYFN